MKSFLFAIAIVAAIGYAGLSLGHVVTSTTFKLLTPVVGG